MFWLPLMVPKAGDNLEIFTSPLAAVRPLPGPCRGLLLSALSYPKICKISSFPSKKVEILRF